MTQFVRVADPALGLRKVPRREFEAKWTGYAALFDYTPAFEQAPESKPTLAWVLPFLSRFKVILLQVLGLAVAVSFLQLLFPVFTQMVVDKVIVENDIGLLKMILLGMFAALVFVQLATACTGIFAGICGRSSRHGSSRFLEPETSVSADELFHKSSNGRYSTTARGCEASSAICRATGSWRLAGRSFSRGRT